MSIYDNRTRPAYGTSWEPEYCNNPHILKWWTPTHDELLAHQIDKEQWQWYWGINDKVVAVTPPEVVEAWKANDPLCKRWAWSSILINFAGARADKLGLTKAIREPAWKTCPFCDHRFVEDSLPVPLVKRLGIDQLDFCSPCLTSLCLHPGSENLSGKEALDYLRDLTSVLQRVPNQGFGEGIDDLRDLSTEERLAVLRILRRKPSAKRVKELFGSWLHALIEAGVLEDGTRRTARGTQCLAKDGHVCLSLGEKTIDDLLYFHRISHEKEPCYPEGNYRADFAVRGTFIEFFGLAGNTDYDAKTKLEQKLCRKHSIKLVSIYPKDLISRKKLENKLLRSLNTHQSGSPSAGFGLD